MLALMDAARPIRRYSINEIVFGWNVRPIRVVGVILLAAVIVSTLDSKKHGKEKKKKKSRGI